jgi:hypothetical protein
MEKSASLRVLVAVDSQEWWDYFIDQPDPYPAFVHHEDVKTI